MGIRLSYKDSNEITGIVDDILEDLELTKEEVLKLMSPRLKRIAIEETRKIKRIKNIQQHTKNKKGERRRTKHLYQDIVVTIKKDEFGEKVLRVGGGWSTGTLWHLVNDGTYRTQPTHFMDKIIKKAEKEFDEILGQALEKRSE